MSRKFKLLIAVVAVALSILAIKGVVSFRNQKMLKQKLTELTTQQADLESRLAEAEQLIRRYDKKLTTIKEQRDNYKRKLQHTERKLVKANQDHGILRFSRNQEPASYTVGDHTYKLDKFHTPSLIYGKHEGSRGSSYLESFEDSLILVSATGIFSHVKFAALEQDEFEMKVIPSNITDIVRYDDFYRYSKTGIKDIQVLGDRIYVSFSNQPEPNCFNTSILVANMSMDRLTFSTFFVPEPCITAKNDYGQFNPHNSGGRMVPYKDNKMLFTHGEYKYRDHAQDIGNPFGKILAIDLETADYEIISMGHRNPQGLSYLDQEDTIYSTEHGPQGGDEINIIDDPGGGVENFGWPISSYGEHYGFQVRDDNQEVYQKAPLYKSHSDYGFIEPVMYFTPSIGISEIEQIPKKFNGVNSTQFLIGAMGNEPLEGDMAIHLVQFDKQYNVTNSEVIPLNERVRDILYVNELNQVIMFLESSPAIGVLETLH